MNKKFLSAILFGALMVASTGTFVSCKDYDDEIDDLQEQINKLATKEDMTSQIASLQSALTAAQSEAAAAKASAEDAVKKATDASSAATEAEKAAAQAALDAANAKTEAIKAAQDEVAKVKAELEAAIDSKFEAAKSEFAETIAELTKKVEGLTGYTTSMVTGLNFVDNNNNDTNLDLKYFRLGKIYFPKDLAPNDNGTTADGDEAKYADPVASYNFAEGMIGAFTVKEKDVNTVPDQMLVNVDPVNAALPADMLSLMNSNGVNLNDYVDITSKTYNGTLTVGPIESRASSSTGLREIGVQLKNTVDFAAFDKLVLVGGNHVQKGCDQADEHEYIAYALTASDAQGHVVTSPYKVNMHVVEEKEAVKINENTIIRSNASISGKTIKDYQKGGDQTNSSEGCFPIKSGESFTISVGSDRTEGGKVMASYVVLASKGDAGLTETDVVALQSMKIDGLKNVLKGANQVHKITVTGAAIPVPLKLVTIDYTGKVKVNMIWVKASEDKINMIAKFTATPKSYVTDGANWTNTAADMDFVPFEVPAGTESYEIYWVIGETDHVTDANRSKIIYKEGGSFSEINTPTSDPVTGWTFKLYKSDKTTQTTTPKDVAYAKFVGSLVLTEMKENKEYVGQIKFYDKTKTYLGTNQLVITKVLPTDIPAGLSIKTNLLHADGTLPVYPKPVEPQSDNTFGTFDLTDAFNITDALAADTHLEFKTPTFKEEADGQVATYGTQTERKISSIVKATIGNKDAKYPTTVTYNYGKILFQEEGHGVAPTEDHIVPWTTKFDFVFGCYVADSEFAWYTEPTVVYSKDIVIDAYETDSDGNKTYYNFMKAKNPYKLAIDPFSNLDKNGWMPWAAAFSAKNKDVTIELWSNGDDKKVNEFFTAEFAVQNEKTCLKLTATETSYTSVPANDVPTTVVFKFKDNFGHDEVIKALTFTMKKNAE